ncbi:hypothetical protein [Klebsiella pneumoniae]|uniref:hypothetical protein n=1 Tax=Klebsiella pneumoniae TaxID=573 RepID=UPI0010E94D4A|nr:hypothetical protein [Klebsiella pneumoniae]VGA26402.1 Uncharacterised protein [Klebsiella pneumoniae]
MTDITELTLMLKLEVHRAVSNFNPQMNVKTRDLKALVEALEKAQSELAKANGVLDKIQSTSCHADTSDGSFIPNSLDAWGRPVPQHLSYDFSGNPGASATQYCNGWNDAGGYWLNYVRELESRTVTVKLPPELYTIGELIRTQDNRITDQPMFVVFQKREIIGSDEHSPSRICWVWDGEEVSELRAKRLEALYQDGRDTRGYDRYAMQEVDEFVTACFTEHGCKDFLRQNGHNLRQPYIYACGSFRNNEYQLVRNWLAGIKWEAE